MNDPRDHHTTQRSRTLRAGRAGGGGASLVVIHGDRLGHRVDIGDGPAVIGRASDCALTIDHRSVSRHHCKVWREDGSYHVRDLGSTNHTYVNDRAVAQSELRDGDHIAVGETVLKFVRRDSLEARYHEALYELATVDSLTQLYNRRKFREFLDGAIERAREDRAPFALLFLDIDHFKAINDRHGHMAGDDVLRAFGAALRAGMRAQDTGGRLGGEEFAIILPGTALDGAVALAERLRIAIETTPVEVAGSSQSVTASLGVAMYGDGMSASDLMRAADDQLLRAKQSGRNRVCVAGR